SATAALNVSEKFRRFVILISIRSGWIDLSTLSNFAGPLHYFFGRIYQRFRRDFYAKPRPS
ncbi:hypothetical protein, partial [Sulfitobacter sp.]|uniref:hypothetical protein n=1 Tax=Sulfitobacter sp. TaxID=1903071 RepID=UPI0030016B54